MAKKSVEITGMSTSKINVLTEEEMKELFIKMKNGDMIARNDLINGNLKLVLSILKKFNGRVDNMDDLFQVGCIGLVKAIDNFSLEFNTKLSTYAVPMIIGEIKRYLRDNCSIRISRGIKDIAYKALKVKEELISKIGREPTIDMIAKKLQLPVIDVANALDSMKDTISMFEPIYNDGGDTIYLMDQLEDKKNKYDEETKISLKEALKKLKEKEKHIIYERYIIGKTQLELAEEIGISQAQISRLEKSGLENIKKMIL